MKFKPILFEIEYREWARYGKQNLLFENKTVVISCDFWEKGEIWTSISAISSL